MFKFPCQNTKSLGILSPALSTFERLCGGLRVEPLITFFFSLIKCYLCGLQQKFLQHVTVWFIISMFNLLNDNLWLFPTIKSIYLQEKEGWSGILCTMGTQMALDIYECKQTHLYIDKDPTITTPVNGTMCFIFLFLKRL